MICPPLITKLLYQLLMILAKHEKNKIKKIEYIHVNINIKE